MQLSCNLLGNDHELLEGKTATSVGATVQDVLEGNGEDVGLLGTGEVGDVDVERDTLLSGSSLGNSQGDTEDGVGTQVTLVGGAVELVEELVNLGLVLDIDALLDESRANGLVDVLHGLEDTYSNHAIRFDSNRQGCIVCTYPCRPSGSCHHHGAQQPRAGLDFQLASLFSSQLGDDRSERTGGGTRGDNGAVQTGLGDNVHLNGGVAARVVHGASVNLGDRHDGTG